MHHIVTGTVADMLLFYLVAFLTGAGAAVGVMLIVRDMRRAAEWHRILERLESWDDNA